jgi:CheY-like chemotaxis protein
VRVLKTKVLLVEDSRLLRITSERALVKAGYEVICAADGEQALRVVHDRMPDLILLDMILPKMAGLNVLRLLKQDPVTTHIPVIVLSGLSQRNEQKLVEAGAAAYWQKSESILDNDSAGLVLAVETVLDRWKRTPGTKVKGAP